MAQGALDAFTETARDARRMARPGVFEKVAESPLIQSLIGQAAARIDAAQTLMLTSLQEGQDIVRAGGTLDIEQRVRIRRNHGFAARTSAEVVNDIFFKSGAAAADEKNRCSVSGATPTPRRCTPASTGTRCRHSMGRSNWGCSRRAYSETERLHSDTAIASRGNHMIYVSKEVAANEGVQSGSQN